MSSIFDTIVAPITGADNAAIAVIRLSGPESWEIASKIFAPWPEAVQPRFALYGHFETGDDGLVLPFEKDHSYTGEQTAELSSHGSRAAVKALLVICLKSGARMARPGEFTERAFLNGRLDLTQAEGVRDTVEALTATQLRQANLLREGALRAEVEAIERGVTGVLANVEACVDFSEEIGDLDKASAATSLRDCQTRIDRLLLTAKAGRILRRGLRIAIVGPPNAGKSSLLNRLLGFDRAIVTEIPGTTRDFVEEKVDLGGVPCILTDTAGLRKSVDRIERIGIELSHKVIQAADEVWYVHDATVPMSLEDEQILARIDRPKLILQNKVDLLPQVVTRAHLNAQGPMPNAQSPSLRISALTGEGLDHLIRSVADRLREAPADSVWINERHEPLLSSARNHLELACKTLGQDLPTDLVSVHLQAALSDFGQITGETASEDMLDRIFRDFCIGK